MKRIITVLLAAALLIGGFAGCKTQADKDLEMFNALNAQMSELEEFSFVADVFVEFGDLYEDEYDEEYMELMGLDGGMGFKMSGTYSNPLEELLCLYEYYSADGDDLFDMELIITGDVVYMSIVSIMEYMMDAMLEIMGIGELSIDMDALFQGNTHIVMSMEELEDEMDADEDLSDLFGPTDTTSLEGVLSEDVLVRDENDVFTLTLRGDEMGDFLDEVMAILDTNILGDDMAAGVDEMLSDLDDILGDEDLSDLNMTLVMSADEDGKTYYQYIELDCMGYYTMTIDCTYVDESVEPVSIPGGVLTLEEYDDLMENADIDSMIIGLENYTDPYGLEYGDDDDDDDDIPPLELNYTDDLNEISLVNNVLGDGSFLENHPLGDDDQYTVAMPASEEVNVYSTLISSYTYNLTIRYYNLPTRYYDLEEAIMDDLDFEYEYAYTHGNDFTISDFRMNQDGTAATVAINAHYTDYDWSELNIYVAQDMGEEIIMLTITVDIDWLEEDDEDLDILAELGQVIGVDLLAYLP